MKIQLKLFVAASIFFALFSARANAQTQLVLLGTGTPQASPERSGPATAVVFNGKSYLFDSGAGVVRRASAAAAQKKIPALAAGQLRRVFLTHLHSDHTVGLSDLIFTPWQNGRTVPIEIWGPKGTRAMVRHIEAAYSQDIDIRVKGLERAVPAGHEAIVHEISGGYVYHDGDVSIEAISVRHGTWPQSFGYKIKTPDRTIVISGDTAPADSLANACNGCDILLHEVYSAASAAPRVPTWPEYMRTFHTSTAELADIAAKAKPKQLILYHILGAPSDVLKEVQQKYSGTVVIGNDLDVF